MASQFEIKNGNCVSTGDSIIGENLITFGTPFKIECLAVIPFDNDGNPVLIQQVRHKSKEGFKVRSYHVTDGKEYTGRNDNFNYIAIGR